MSNRSGMSKKSLDISAIEKVSERSKKSAKPMDESLTDALKKIEKMGSQKSKADVYKSVMNETQKTGSKLEETKNTAMHIKDAMERSKAPLNDFTIHSKKSKKGTEFGEKYMENEAKALSGEWGSKQVFASNVQGGFSKLGYDDAGVPRQQVGEVRQRLIEIYGTQSQPPDCFVA